MQASKLHWQNLPADALQRNTDLIAEWDRLNAARADLPFMTAHAVQLALTIFGSGTERLLVAKQSESIVAMLVLVPDGLLQWRTFQPSQLPLGVWVAENSLSSTDLARSLVKGPLGLCLVLSITQIDPLIAPRELDQADTKQIDYIDTGWIEITGTFEDYWAARGKNLRQNMRKQRNKLAAEGVVTSMRVLIAPEEMADAIARYGVLESSGWKASEGTAIHPENQQGQFYIQLFQNAAKHDGAVVYEYLFNEKTVALNLCIQRKDSLVILKTTYDESIQAYSPAFLLSQDEVEHIFGQGKIRRLEYYGRMMEWHTRWTESKRTLYHLTCYRWAWLKNLAGRRQKKTEHIDTSLPQTLAANHVHVAQQVTPQESSP
ncbi:Acetyltransferase involved in cellulose biosynthesis, CelD/BcsL family [Rhodoferax sp. OV413]|uniref:GNAT family N-acetyltransferase n=1 Tax=Rhodoferax sp. OV413 TaxID=1855285 RepID=UPI000882DD46|nr:GNAT family N-acetyltransferase [Rhodoferax sp. OV413]SDP85790.1 Acetyltransferase involved in cellulose biosynthesis, CelD/BcsL family [Rhodoferax sp. OV413]